MKFLILAVGLFSFSVSAKNLGRMPDGCYQKLIPLVHDSVQASKWEILSALQYDWRLHPELSVAKYDECGPSDFFYISIDKNTCTVSETGAGDSDGECE